MWHHVCRQLEADNALRTLANRAIAKAEGIARQAPAGSTVQLDQIDNTTLLLVQFLREKNIRVTEIFSDDPASIGKPILGIPVRAKISRDVQAGLDSGKAPLAGSRRSRGSVALKRREKVVA